MRHSFKTLEELAALFQTPARHLRHLLDTPDRLQRFSIRSESLFYDFSRQRLDERVVQALAGLAEETGAKKQFRDMAAGKMVNTTEKRAALHTETRRTTDCFPGPADTTVTREILRVKDEIRAFSSRVRSGKIKGGGGQVFTDAVVVGIGGSYLGCEFAYEALQQVHDPRIKLHFLSNVDIDNFGRVVKEIDPPATLWIIISKSYTTTETMANLAQALNFIETHTLSPQDHLVTITAKGSPGDDPDTPVLASFHMFDVIGGRYSVTSAVGGLPLSLAFGFDVFERFLAGCHAVDTHAAAAPVKENIPLMAALINIWNIRCLGYTAQGIIPYSSALSKLAPHVQQLYMESIGKNVTRDGRFLETAAGCIIFGEPGTNAQHSFFQLAHQGPAFPMEFIGVLTPAYDGTQVFSKGVSNHQELWANLMAQTMALALGRDHDLPAKSFEGNRPSSLLVIKDLSARSIGSLLAYYEARTVFEGFILGINPFDQFGVELGKVLASGIREEMAARNADPDHRSGEAGETVRFYTDALFRGKIS